MMAIISALVMAFCAGIVFGMTITCCCVISGRADKQLGIRNEEE